MLQCCKLKYDQFNEILYVYILKYHVKRIHENSTKELTLALSQTESRFKRLTLKARVDVKPQYKRDVE